MSLKKGQSKEVISENISELHKGPHHAQMKKKFGAAKANKIDVAIAYDESRKSGKRGRGG